VLHAHLAGIAESRARLQREAHAVAKLRHENILEIFDYSGPDSRESYIVTEFIHGRTLKAFLSDHPLPFPEVAEMVVSEVCRALEHAHGLGVIHRDIKPENVMIRNDGMLKLMDFGIAQIIDKERMTVTGQLLGSPAYMAPEHVEGRPLDFRTDVFAVGILLYQLATGQLPFSGKNPHEVLKKIAECRYKPPEQVNPKIGARLARAIKKALQRDPDQRFPDVAPLRKELSDDLLDAGIDDPRRELSGFFSDPKGWVEPFKTRLVAQLAKRGQELKKKGRTAAALELWSRALAIEPQSREVRELVEGAESRQRMKRVAAWAGALVAIGGACVAGAFLVANRPDPPKPPLVVHKPEPVVAKPEPVVTKTEPVVVKAEPAKKLSAVTKRVVDKPVAPPADKPSEPALRALAIAPFPRKVSLSLDGRDLGEYDPSNPPKIDDKPHTLKLVNPRCFPRTVEIAAGTSADKLEVRLPWKPAMLTLKSSAKITWRIDGVVGVFDSGQPIQIDIPASSTDGWQTVVATVSSPGQAERKLNVKVRAGDSHEEKVTFDAPGSP
jgi:serine/threonine-protein kinase